MKKVILTFRRTIIFLIKITLYISLLSSFFLIMGIENWQPPTFKNCGNYIKYILCCWARADGGLWNL